MIPSVGGHMARRLHPAVPQRHRPVGVYAVFILGS
jgi:hypothetical protein